VTVSLGWIQLVTLAGAVQGFLLAGVLAAHRSNRTANRLLAVLMATFSVYLLQDVYYSAGLIRTYPHFFGISYPLPWVFGPLVYLYAVTASDRTRRFQRRDLLHFLLPGIVILLALPIYMMGGPDKIALFDRLAMGDVPAVIRIEDPTKYISGAGYSIATLAHLRRHRRRIEDTYSSIERVNLRWLIWLSAAAAAVWLLAILKDMTDTLSLLGDVKKDSVALAIALLVYAIGYMGLRQPEIFRYDSPSPSSSPAPVSASIEQSAPRVEQRVEPPFERVERVERYERSGLSNAEAQALKAALLAMMTRDQPYRDPDLTLPELAGRLDTTPHKLSEVLNSELSQTFYDFVNSYRVEEVRDRLAKSDSRNLSILTLAMDAGFASKSTFNQVFKKQTGQTPSTYRKALAS